MSRFVRHPGILSLMACAAVTLAACGTTSITAGPTTGSSLPARSAAPASTQPASSDFASAASPSAPISGFAFAADDIVLYYESVGYTCSAPRPSTTAAGYTVRTCETVDDQGRTRGVGVVTDPVGALANAFASVQAKPGETFLAPIDALDPLAGFLGATLGPEQGASLLEWLAGHLGDPYVETTVGPLKVATYSESAEDHTKLYVELATQAYLDAPSAAP